MVASIIMISLAFIWLGIETDFMRVRLPYGKATANKTLLLPASKTTPVLLLDTVHYKPSEFTPLDMPEFIGKLNINCKRC